jgi:hypothetical protein
MSIRLPSDAHAAILRAFSFQRANLFLPRLLVQTLLLIRLHFGIEDMHARLYRFFHRRAFEHLASVDANVPFPFRGRHRVSPIASRHVIAPAAR